MSTYLAGAALVFFSVLPWAAAAPAEGGATRRVIEEKGLGVVFEALPLGAAGPLREGDVVRFRFQITAGGGKTPIRGATARAWVDPRRGGEVPAANAASVKAARFLSGGIFGKAGLDLNSFYVLALNGDATITVVDPLFGFGSTKLLALIPLSGVGYDWALTADQSRLFVSIPEKKQIAVIDTSRWEVAQSIETGLQPARIALQPDGQTLWVAGGGDSQTTLAAFRTDTLAPIAKWPIGRGRHELAFSGNSAFVLVTDGEANSVAVIDTRIAGPAKVIKVGRGPVAAAYSELANAFYVGATESGEISVIDAKRLVLTKTIKAPPGLADLAAAPRGRSVLAVNRKTDAVQVIDASSAEIIQTGTVGPAPFQISFSRELAYINHLGSAEVFMLPLDQLGKAGQPLAVVTFPAGQHPAGAAALGSPAARIVPVPGEGAVLVAGTRDREVYFYKEGMAAPMGSFTNYSREPLAVQVVDRSLRERGTPGVYETVAQVGKSGLYDVVFFLDSPKIVHGFELTVAPNPVIEAARHAPKVLIEPVAPAAPAKVGGTATFRFRVANKETNEPISGLRDMVIMVMTPGNWHERQVAKEEEKGIYTVAMSPPKAGVYYAHAQCLSLNVDFGNPHYPILVIQPGSTE
jgi:YVTN family beta-propeller protein